MLNMLKKFLLSVVFMPIMAYADYPFTKQDLIGKWEFKGLEDEYFHYTGDIEYRDDGVMSDRSVMYKWAKDDDFYQIDTVRMLLKYRVVGDKVIYYDGIVQSYAVDMPNLDESVYYLATKDKLMNAMAMMERSEFEKEMSDEMITRIRFLDKDTYISAFEDIDEDFPTDIDNNHCKRKI